MQLDFGPHLLTCLLMRGMFDENYRNSFWFLGQANVDKEALKWAEHFSAMPNTHRESDATPGGGGSWASCQGKSLRSRKGIYNMPCTTEWSS